MQPTDIIRNSCPSGTFPPFPRLPTHLPLGPLPSLPDYALLGQYNNILDLRTRHDGVIQSLLYHCCTGVQVDVERDTALAKLDKEQGSKLKRLRRRARQDCVLWQLCRTAIRRSNTAQSSSRRGVTADTGESNSLHCLAVSLRARRRKKALLRVARVADTRRRSATT